VWVWRVCVWGGGGMQGVGEERRVTAVLALPNVMTSSLGMQLMTMALASWMTASSRLQLAVLSGPVAETVPTWTI